MVQEWVGEPVPGSAGPCGGRAESVEVVLGTVLIRRPELQVTTLVQNPWKSQKRPVPAVVQQSYSARKPEFRTTLMGSETTEQAQFYPDAGPIALGAVAKGYIFCCQPSRRQRHFEECPVGLDIIHDAFHSLT